MVDVSTSADRTTIYQQRVRRFEAEGRAWERRYDSLANLRIVAAAFVAAVLAGAWWRDAGPYWPWFLTAGIGVCVFIALVAGHRWVRRQQARAAGMATLNRHGLARLDRRWDRLPAVEIPPGVELTATARDLDLFGPASLFRLCCLANTGAGRACLARWLLTPAAPEDVLARQQSVAELASHLDLRQELALGGKALNTSTTPTDTTPLVTWAEGSGWLALRPLLTWYSRLSPLLLALLAIFDLFGLTAGLWWQFLVCGQVAVSYLLVDRIHHADHFKNGCGGVPSEVA